MPGIRDFVSCNTCVKSECSKGFPEGIPSWCASKRYQDIVDQAKTVYSESENANIYIAAYNVIKKGHGGWPRVQEAIEFAKELKLKKIGLASCSALLSELGIVAHLFTGAGFEVVCSACKIGGLYPEDLGIRNIKSSPTMFSCNPITQAEICNKEGTELNYILGLCLGHDILFMRYSKAPVSTLIVKDKVTGHNPAAVLYAQHPRKALFDQYCNMENPK